MNKIDFEETFKMMKELWPNWKDTDSEFGLYWSWFQRLTAEQVKKLIIDVAGENDFKPPRKMIRQKIAVLRSNEPRAEYNWIDCYIVCVAYDGDNIWNYQGRLSEVAMPPNLDDASLIRALEKYVEKWFIPAS